MKTDIATGIEAIESSIRNAERCCDRYYQQYRDDVDLEQFKHYVEQTFFNLLVLVDRLGLGSTYAFILATYEKAQAEGFDKHIVFEGEVFPYWTNKALMLADAIASSHGLTKTRTSELNDLKAVLKRAAYTICDTSLFSEAPNSEAVVHARLEGVLRCYYPDLKSKPSIDKPIKSFEPDTGLTSIRTLLEYKFVTTRKEAKLVVDQILADASGYRSSEWASLLFVIYETERLIMEEEWQSLLKHCRLTDGFDVVVLPGVTPGTA